MRRLDDIVAPVGFPKHGIAQAPPLSWKLGSETPSKYPVEFAAQAGGYSEENELSDAAWIGLGVRQSQGAAPRTTKNEPTVDGEVLAKTFYVANEVVGGVGGQVDVGDARVGSAAATVALVVEHDAVTVRVEEATVPRGAAGAWSSVQNESRLPLGVAAGFPIEEMPVADFELAVVVRFD